MIRDVLQPIILNRIVNESLYILDALRSIRERIKTRALPGSKLYSRPHSAEVEWLVLGYLVELLSATGVNVPQFGKRTESETDLARNEPDSGFMPIQKQRFPQGRLRLLMSLSRAANQSWNTKSLNGWVWWKSIKQMPRHWCGRHFLNA